MKINKDGTITKKLDYTTESNLEGSLDQAIRHLTDYKNRYSDHSNLRLTLEDEDYGEGKMFVLRGDRPPTELEKAEETAIEIRNQRQRETWDRAELARLKAKYEKSQGAPT